ncbi:MAG: MarR family transcriptional regulator [Ilumatobacteraceae bacterium]
MHLNVLLAANRANEAVDRICADAGITHAQYVALWNLCLGDHADTGLPVGELADGLINRAADATRLVDRMVRAGLAERLANPDDRRSVLVRATADGRAAFEAATPELQCFHQQQWAALTDDELRTLDRLLARALWADAADTTSDESGDAVRDAG